MNWVTTNTQLYIIEFFFLTSSILWFKCIFCLTDHLVVFTISNTCKYTNWQQKQYFWAYRLYFSWTFLSYWRLKLKKKATLKKCALVSRARRSNSKLEAVRGRWRPLEAMWKPLVPWGFSVPKILSGSWITRNFLGRFFFKQKPFVNILEVGSIDAFPY